MSGNLLEIESLKKHFDGVVALEGFSCSVHEREIVGIIGPNGAGKTTFFNVITGFLDPDGGHATFCGKNILKKKPHKMVKIGIARTFQNLRLIRRLTVLENVLLAFQDQPGEHLRNVFFRPMKSKDIELKNRQKAHLLLEEVGLGEKIHDSAENLSYGQQKLLSIVCCIATESNLLLLDEPVAGIAQQMIEKILAIIKALPEKGKSVILIEHNFDAVMEVCDRVIFMDAGRKISEGTPDEIRNDARVIEAYID